MRANRDTSDLSSLIGGDSPIVSLPTIDAVSPVYPLDTLAFALATRTRIAVWAGLTPSTLAAQFSAISIQPKFDCYLTKMVVSANCLWIVVDGNGVVPLNTVDLNPGATWVFPEGAVMVSSGGTGSLLEAPGSSITPGLFNQFQMGRNIGALGAGVFATGNSPVVDPGGPPLFLKAGRTLVSNCTLANTAIAYQLQFEFTAKARAATDINGRVLIPT